jgi:hypothetical protein
MKLKELLDSLDHEVWLRCANPDGSELFTVWSADWIGGHGETHKEVEPWLDYEVDDVAVGNFIDPEYRRSYTSMITCTLYPPKAPQDAKFCLRYRGCAKGDIHPTKAQDPEVGKIVVWTLPEILEEINRERSSGWTDYDETDWKEGLDEWTWYELIGEVV